MPVSQRVETRCYMMYRAEGSYCKDNQSFKRSWFETHRYIGNYHSRPHPCSKIGGYFDSKFLKAVSLCRIFIKAVVFQNCYLCGNDYYTC